MAYTKTVWTDRVVSRPLTYQFQSNGDGTTTLVPSEGTITTTGTPITANTMNNLETQYDKAMADVSTLYLPLTGAKTITGDITLSVGADTTPLTLINDNGQIILSMDATDNSIISMNNNGTASRDFTIEGYNGGSVNNFLVRANITTLTGTLTLSVGGTLSLLASNGFTHFTLKKATMKSWTVQHSASGDLVYYPSATNDGTDWVTANAFSLKTDGSLNARVLQENGVNLASKYSPIASPTFTGTVTVTTLNGTTITGTTINATNLQISGTPLSNIYVDKTLSSLQTLTGNLTAPTINGSTVLQEGGLSLTQRYLRLDGTNNFTGSTANFGSANVQGSTFTEGGTLLTSKYAQLGTANTFATNQTISTGSLTINEGTMIVGSVTNDGRMRMNFTASTNWIQSGNQASAAKNLTISGYNASTISNIDILATTVDVTGSVLSTVTYTNIPMQNGWTANGTGQQLRYAVLPGNICHIQGIITGGTRTPGTLLGTLPSTVVPKVTQWEMCMVRMTGDVKMSSIDVNTDRTIAVGGIGWTQTGQTWVSINIFIAIV